MRVAKSIPPAKNNLALPNQGGGLGCQQVSTNTVPVIDMQPTQCRPGWSERFTLYRDVPTATRSLSSSLEARALDS